MNVKDLREKADLSQQELADLTGIPKNRIAKWEQGKGSPKTADSETLKRFFEEYVPRDTLMREPAQDYLQTRRGLKNEEKDDTLLFYDINANAAARNAGEIFPVKKGEGIHISDLFKRSQYAVRISGNSMTPNYPSGAIIGIRQIEDKQITPGSVYVIEVGDDLWIKRLFYKDDDQNTGVFQLISDNTMVHDKGPRQGKLCYPGFEVEIDKVRKLFKVTGIYKPNELTVIN